MWMDSFNQIKMIYKKFNIYRTTIGRRDWNILSKKI